MTGLCSKEGQVLDSELKQRSGRGGKRTSVDSKRDDRKHPDNPTLVRTQDPSPPDEYAVGDNILNQISGSRVSWLSTRGMIVNDVRV
jgi:hypothetical protein